MINYKPTTDVPSTPGLSQLHYLLRAAPQEGPTIVEPYSWEEAEPQELDTPQIQPCMLTPGHDQVALSQCLCIFGLELWLLTTLFLTLQSLCHENGYLSLVP